MFVIIGSTRGAARDDTEFWVANQLDAPSIAEGGATTPDTVLDVMLRALGT